jgi:transcriptional regulator with XRE-family HTH domain
VTLGEKIQQLRKAGGFSQEQLAEQLHVSRQSVSKWELNESIPDIDKLVMISRKFSVSLDDLLKEDGRESNGSGADSANTSMERIVKVNMANKQIVSGIWTMVIGFVMLVLEFAFLPLYGLIHKSVVDGQGFYTDAINYASVQPMPVIFTLTAIIIVIGICLIAAGHFNKKRSLVK